MLDEAENLHVAVPARHDHPGPPEAHSHFHTAAASGGRCAPLADHGRSGPWPGRSTLGAAGPLHARGRLGARAGGGAGGLLGSHARPGRPRLARGSPRLCPPRRPQPPATCSASGRARRGGPVGVALELGRGRGGRGRRRGEGRRRSGQGTQHRAHAAGGGAARSPLGAERTPAAPAPPPPSRGRGTPPRAARPARSLGPGPLAASRSPDAAGSRSPAARPRGLSVARPRSFVTFKPLPRAAGVRVQSPPERRFTLGTADCTRPAAQGAASPRPPGEWGRVRARLSLPRGFRNRSLAGRSKHR